METADAVTQRWPNQRLKMLIPSFILLTISSLFVIWRFVYGFVQKRMFMLSDYLLIIATLHNIAATSLNKVIVDAALGRHIDDPSIKKPEDILRYSYFLWITQNLNMMGIAFLKWSICTWLLVLNFSRLYKGIVWLSILMVTVLNFIIPTVMGLRCTPIEANWNFGYQGKKRCFTGPASLPLLHSQGISSILTDVVYMAAPLIYLSRIQLARRTQWGIRVVFLLSIPATICSIFKTIELRALTHTQDPTWDSVNLDIWSQAELSIGILIASLPPLRNAFDKMFQRIFPSTLHSSRTTNQLGYSRSSHANHIRLNDMQSRRATKSGVPHESILDSDNGSERAILEDQAERGAGIVKTVDVKVVTESEETDGEACEQNSNWVVTSHMEDKTRRSESK